MTMASYGLNTKQKDLNQPTSLGGSIPIDKLISDNYLKYPAADVVVELLMIDGCHVLIQNGRA